jgi:hypothetical protein
MKSTEDSLREPSLHLWGTSLRVYFDYLINPMFTVNAYLEGIYYPWQYADAPHFTQGAVSHYLDITTEVEGRFQYPLPDSGLVLMGGIPINFFIAPVYNALDSYAPDMQYRFSVGAWFGVTFTNTPVPIDVFLKYTAPLVGENDQGVHKISLVGRVTIPISGGDN